MTDINKADGPEPNPEEVHGKPDRSTRLWRWIDVRTGADELLHKSLDEPVPGGARFAYVFGSALLFIFISQVITGICLAVYYVPSPLTAHVTLAYIIKVVAGGAFLRSLHSYGSSAMIVVLVLHFLQTFLYGSYKGRRELLWMSGCILSLLVLGMTFTGYLLRWDLKAYFSGAVGTNLVGDIPLIGGWLLRLTRGGSMMGALTLSRFYVLHLFILPAMIFIFVAVHIFMFRKAGAAGPIDEDPLHPHLPAETFYPKQVIIDMVFVLIVMGVLGMLAHFVPEELGPVADPTNSKYLPRPEWYYLPFFQWLKYWEGAKTFVGVILIPGILIGLVFVLPFLDRSLERRPWKRPIPVGTVLIVLIALIGLGMQSRLEDSRDPTTAAQIAQQNLEEDNYFHAPFQPYSGSSAAGGAAPVALSGAAAQGKTIFESQGCNGCHGSGGVGGAGGPSLTQTSGKFQPPQLTALLKEPNAKMKAGGMVPLTLNAADMAALVSYLSSLGGTPDSSGSTPTPDASAPAPTEAKQDAPSAPSNAPTATPASVPAQPNSQPDSTSSTSKQAAPVTGATARGKAIFDSQGCKGCHGAGGVGGAGGPAVTQISGKFQPPQLTALLKEPNAKMQAGGMVPLTLNAADLKALVSYLSSLGRTPAASASKPKAGSSPPATTEADSGAPAAPPSAPTATPASVQAQPNSQPDSTSSASKQAAPATGAAAQGKTIFDSQGCNGCHSVAGVGGGRGPALTQISGKFQPPQLTALLKEPNAKMKAGGMVTLTLNAADMTALVSYINSPGGTSDSSATKQASPSEAAQPAPPSQTGSANLAVAGQPANPSNQGGEAIYNAQGCAGCHGPGGIGSGRAPALTGANKTMTPEALASLLEHPNQKMQSGGMAATKLSPTEMSALVAYVENLGSAAAVTAAGQGQYSENKEDVRIHAKDYPPAIQKGYRIFVVKCNTCHGLDKSLQAGVSPAQAVAEIKRMQSMASSQINDEQAKKIVDFLNYDRAHPKP